MAAEKKQKHEHGEPDEPLSDDSDITLEYREEEEDEKNHPWNAIHKIPRVPRKQLKCGCGCSTKELVENPDSYMFWGHGDGVEIFVIPKARMTKEVWQLVEDNLENFQADWKWVCGWMVKWLTLVGAYRHDDGVILELEKPAGVYELNFHWC